MLKKEYYSIQKMNNAYEAAKRIYLFLALSMCSIS